MILNVNEHTGEITTLYFEIHGEYTGALEGVKRFANRKSGEPRDYIHINVAFDFNLLCDASDCWDAKRDNGDVSDSERPALVQEAFDNLFPYLRKELDIDPTDNFGRVWMLLGTPLGHRRAFAALAGAVDHRPSGDDDTFDYWPNAMRMLHSMAVDLDAMIPTPVLRKPLGPVGFSCHLERYTDIRVRNTPEAWAQEINLP